MSAPVNHAVIVVSINPPDKIMGFFLKEGGTPEAQALYDELHVDREFTEEEALPYLSDVRQCFMDLGFNCGPVETKTSAGWLEQALARALTEEERAHAMGEGDCIEAGFDEGTQVREGKGRE